MASHHRTALICTGLSDPCAPASRWISFVSPWAILSETLDTVYPNRMFVMPYGNTFPICCGNLDRVPLRLYDILGIPITGVPGNGIPGKSTSTRKTRPWKPSTERSGAGVGGHLYPIPTLRGRDTFCQSDAVLHTGSFPDVLPSPASRTSARMAWAIKLIHSISMSKMFSKNLCLISINKNAFTLCYFLSGRG
ncbi:unnamed protein product [Trypanosoma congolense IL3000]|uniref:WGS project CAEQ00000000 data, annotated contig 463 n=1 Tax=Trypanosoma congolense (strain IL3000) TaxID=1068625 RepID=F9WG44_TRYCI|nr:unnamed protein product [Trypanosoma congolense IL3000]